MKIFNLISILKIHYSVAQQKMIYFNALFWFRTIIFMICSLFTHIIILYSFTSLIEIYLNNCYSKIIFIIFKCDQSCIYELFNLIINGFMYRFYGLLTFRTLIWKSSTLKDNVMLLLYTSCHLSKVVLFIIRFSLFCRIRKQK